VMWPALVRRMLLERSAIAAVEVLQNATLSSGHNYLVADKNQVFNVETTGRAYRVTHTDAAAPYWHTNHYLSDELLPLQLPLHPATTTHDRYATLCRIFGTEAPTSFESLWALMGSHEGYPRSICSHGRGDDPSASKTCGGVICDVAGGRFLASAGCLHGTPWTEVRP
jgi:isopenicillin-N N-acyltransferase-like protein